MIKSIYTLLLLFLFSSCYRDKTEFTIKGSLKGYFPNKIYLFKLKNTGIVPVDSTKMSDKGEFFFKAKTNIPAFYLLKIKNSKGIYLLASPHDNIKIYINADNFDIEYVVEGSIESRRISKLTKEHHKTLGKITDLSIEYEKNMSNPNFQSAKYDSQYTAIEKNFKVYATNFIMESPGSFSSLMALYLQLGIKTPPVFDRKKDFKLFELVDSSLTALYPTSEAVIKLNREVVEMREKLKLEVGAVAPEIALPDTSNQTISLKSFNGKYVLINFWASWCSECREQTRHLIKTYQKYKEKGFMVYQVSLDKTKKSWREAIEQDEIPYVNVSDLKFWNSKAAKLYKVENIPYNVLIDRKGEIVEKNIRLTKLDSVLNKL